MRPTRTMLLASTVALSALSFACGDAPLPTLSVTADPTTIASGQSTQLTITTEHFELMDPQAAGEHTHGLTPSDDGDTTPGQHAQDGDDIVSTREGHYHVYLDSTDVNPILMDYRSPVDLTVTASAGPHRLIVRLQALDHRIVQPEIIATVDMTITD